MNNTIFTFYRVPCNLNEVRNVLKHSPYEFQIVELPKFPTEFLYSDYLDYVFLFGLFTSFAVLTYYSKSNNSSKCNSISEDKYCKDVTITHKNCNKTKSTEKDYETKDTGDIV